ncbi:PREDICTED: solute carrier family 2, facilitated glucose transporter member 3-like isoform X2 [Dinoponera quadriceps]|uniref:Solute carrier family 2, facilitated glucose transporter member 3-like isoform X2 n=1 Tax=Dinoponera quadriceps TaxID=609295 RepID=A0A6P3XRW5_DINQU|nr:PREDICTED: solute carrier family 2, facilitated glucose transporter member 3-like isoform X2 [Dinoponera quadriceps]
MNGFAAERHCGVHLTLPRKYCDPSPGTAAITGPRHVPRGMTIGKRSVSSCCTLLHLSHGEKKSQADVSTLCIDVTKVKSLNGEPRKSETRNNAAYDAESGGWTPLLVLAGATCCLGSALPAGFNIGVMNNPADLMMSFCNQSIRERFGTEISVYQLKILWSSIISVFLIGGVTGSLAASWLSDRFGRKGAMAAGNVCGILGGFLFFLLPITNSVELFLLGRIFVGLSGGLATSLLPMYLTEIAPLKLRGAVGVLCQLGMTCGVLMGQIAGLDSVLGTRDSWNIMLASFAPLCAAALFLIFALPESPKYLYIIKGQHGKALKELGRLRNMDVMLLQNEVADLQKELQKRSTSESWSIKRVLSEPTLRLPLFLVCFMQFGQQLSGINAVFYYSNSILRTAGFDHDEAEYATLGTGVANILMAIVSVPVMSFFSRRKVLMLSGVTSAICLIVLCISIALIETSPFVAGICIAAVLAYVVFYGIGLGPIPYFIGSELFDVGPRPAAMSLGSMFNWGGNFIVGMLFPIIAAEINSFAFLIFAGFTLLLVAVNKIYLPETRGRSTADIAATMTQGFKSRPNAN